MFTWNLILNFLKNRENLILTKVHVSWYLQVGSNICSTAGPQTLIPANM